MPAVELFPLHYFSFSSSRYSLQRFQIDQAILVTQEDVIERVFLLIFCYILKQLESVKPFLRAFKTSLYDKRFKNIQALELN